MLELLVMTQSHVNEAAGNEVGGDHHGLYTDYSAATAKAFSQLATVNTLGAFLPGFPLVQGLLSVGLRALVLFFMSRAASVDDLLGAQNPNPFAVFCVPQIVAQLLISAYFQYRVEFDTPKLQRMSRREVSSVMKEIDADGFRERITQLSKDRAAYRDWLDNVFPNRWTTSFEGCKIKYELKNDIQVSMGCRAFVGALLASDKNKYVAEAFVRSLQPPRDPVAALADSAAGYAKSFEPLVGWTGLDPEAIAKSAVDAAKEHLDLERNTA